MTKLSYNLEEAAAATGLSTTHLKKEVREGRLKTKTTKLNDKQEPVGRRLILAGELEGYLSRLDDA
jgi:hypothetical protein